MRKLVAAGFCLVLIAEVIALLLPDRRLVLWTSGAALALVLLSIRGYLTREIDPAPKEAAINDAGESLRRWVSRTETQIRRSESTRADWDRHLRPMLARQFEMATGQKQAKNPGAFQAGGRMLFGPQLWAWVDPENVSRTGDSEPGPGRAALDDILRRLEQV
ncbi:hypothetical protein [Mycobacterium sp.]|jgi:hypothetical protein|uniref:hypothetical protein n=1 Tax=Mycobacterium sp. TaxID=1785 RepID=UPI002D22C2F5|nr:hypothetical protein [Mycobacterium sp.]HZA09224.1 hypothetical protein [Mycobacterium sp.]